MTLLPDAFDCPVRLGGEAASATATLDGVGIFERKPTLVETFIEVDRGAIEEQVAPLIDGYGHTVLLGDVVFGSVGIRVESQTVLVSATPAAGDTDS